MGLIGALGGSADRGDVDSRCLFFPASSIAAVAGIPASLVVLVCLVPQVGSASAHVGTDGQRENGDDKSGYRNEPHPAFGAKRDDTAKNQCHPTQCPKWPSDGMRIVPCFLGFPDFREAQSDDTITRQLAHCGQSTHDQEDGSDDEKQDSDYEHAH